MQAKLFSEGWAKKDEEKKKSIVTEGFEHELGEVAELFSIVF